MRLTFWGVRGSVPSPGRDAWRYGGNTACVEIAAADGQLFILDAGTGIRDLGQQLLAEFASPGLKAHLFLTHYHWDHIQGLPFFEPLYFAGNTIHIFGPTPQGELPASLPGVLQMLFRAPFFPVSPKQLRASYPLRELDWQSDFTVGATRIRTCRVHHPQGALAYRLDSRRASLVYATDHEPGNPECDAALRQLAAGADLLISDAQYRPEELGAQKSGWGHSSWQAAVDLARDAGVKNLVLFHHQPSRTDREIDQLLHAARQAFPNTLAAAEGLRIDLAPRQVRVDTRVGRLSQRQPLRLPVQVETQQAGALVRDQALLENLSFQGAYFLSLQPYEVQQPVDLAVPLSPNGNGHGNGNGDPPAEAPELRLRGYVVRTDPQTTNGGWTGVAVLFPGSRGPNGP